MRFRTYMFAFALAGLAVGCGSQAERSAVRRGVCTGVRLGCAVAERLVCESGGESPASVAEEAVTP